MTYQPTAERGYDDGSHNTARGSQCIGYLDELRDRVKIENVEPVAPLRPQLPWTLISDEVIDATFLNTTRLWKNDHSFFL